MTLSVGTVGSEFTVAITSNFWTDSAVLTNGNIVFAWAGGAGGAGAAGRIYDSSGAPVTAVIQLSNDHPGIGFDGNGMGARVAALSGGGFELVWTGENQSGTTAPIYARTFDAAGNPLDSDVQIVANGDPNEQATHPIAVSGLAGEKAAVAWAEGDGLTSNLEIKAELIDSAGNQITAPVSVSDPSHYAYDPSIVHLSGGGFVVTWIDSATGPSQIHAHLYDNSFNPVGSEFVVNSTSGFSVSGSAALAALTDGGFVATWLASDGSHNYISARIFDASGNPAGNDFTVNTSYPADSGGLLPVVTALSGGGFAVAWTDTSHQAPDTDNEAVRARVFDSAGVAVGDDFVVNTTTTHGQGGPAISALNDGGFVVSWNDRSVPASPTLRAQMFSVTNAVAAPTVINGNSESLAAIDEDAANPSGSSVQNLFGSHFSDADANFAGVAVTSNAATTQGTWQYSSDGGTNWTGVGAPNSSSALLLDTSALVRFVPAADYNGAAPALTVHLVNDSHGAITTGDSADLSTTGGDTSYSLGAIGLGETINPVNDPPALANAGNTINYVQHQATPPFVDNAITILDLDSPLLVGATVKISSGFLDGDQLNFTGLNFITGSYDDAHGVLTLSGTDAVFRYQAVLRSVTFSSTSDHPTEFGADPQRTITWQVDDGSQSFHLSNTVQTTINITAIDGPTNTVPAAQSAGEDGSTAISGISVSDADAGSNTITTTLSVAHGTLTIAPAGGAAVSGSDTASVTLTGTAAEINTTLAAADNVLYTPGANFNGPDTLTVTTDDQGNNISGTPVSDTDTVTINVSAVNDAPTVVNGSTTALVSINEDAASPAGDTIANLFGGHLSDVTDQVSGGSSANSLAGIAISANATTAAEGTWQWSSDGTTWHAVSGSVSDTGALVLAASTQLRFLPAANWNGSAPELTAHLIDDSSAITNNSSVDLTATGTGGTTQYSTGTVALGQTVNPVNDPVTASIPSTATLAEDSSAAISGLSIADVDAALAPNGIYQVTLSASHGALTLSSLTGLAFTGGDGTADATMTFHGTLSAINSALATASYAGAANYNGSDTIAFTVTDQFNSVVATGSGSATSDSKNVSVTVTAVNDPVTASAPSTASLAEDSSVAISGLSIADLDATLAPNGIYEVTLSASHGAMTLSTLTGLTFTAGDGTADATMTFHGTLSAINTALATASYAGLANYNGADTIALSVTDQFNSVVATGSGSFTSDSKNVSVTVTAVNDAVTASAPSTASLAEDSSVAISALSIGDVDATLAPNGVYAVTLSASHGTLTLSTLTGLTFTGGDGTADGSMTFHGTLSAINAALATASYAGAANYNGSDTIALSVTDQFNSVVATGSGSASSDSKSIAVTVTPVADTPSVTNAPTAEDIQTTSGLVISRNTADGAEVANFKITSITNGSLFKHDGTTAIHNGDFITFAEGNAGLKFTPTADLNGSAGDTFWFDVQASTSASNAGLGGSVVTASVTVSEVNDAPVATNDTLSSVAEDSGQRSISFASLTANDSRGPANESSQTLTIAGVSNAVGGSVSISGTNVLFTPAANFNGAASFDYTVQDNGTTNSGPDPKSGTGHVSFTVTPVNDAPVAQNGSASGNEDAAITGTLVATDIDNASFTFSRVANAAHGNVTVNADGTFSYMPSANFNGNDSFTFKANDGSADSNTATVSLTVNPVDDAPVFANTGGASHTVATEQTFARLDGVVTISDVELDALNGGNGNYMGASLIIGRTAAANPVYTFSFSTAGASFTVDSADHTLLAGGQIFAVYSIPSSGSQQGSISITFTSQNTPATTALLDNVLQHISYENLSDTPPASVTMHWTFNDGNVGGAQGAGGNRSDTANRVVDITPVNDAPVAQDGSASGNEDAPITGTLVATDVDSLSLAYSRVSDATHGSVTVNADGTFSYTPTANFNGSDSFTFTVNDGSLDSNVATISLTVNPVNDAPMITSDGGGDTVGISIPENTTPVTTIMATDIESASLSYSIVGGSDSAKFQIDAAGGALSFITAPDFEIPTDADHNNSYVVQVRASDGSLSDDQVITVQVTNVDDTVPTVHWAASIDVGAHPAGWQPAGIADFNNDGTSDLAWYNASTRDLEIWKLAGGQWSGSSDIGTHPVGGQPEGFADFNNDGTNDALWFNPTTRDLDLWKIADGQWAGSVDIGTHPAGWQPAGAADFNHDGTSDVLWYNQTTGNAEIWKTQNGQWAGSVDLGNHPTGWQPAAADDFNGDGTSDIAWYNASTRDVEIWTIQNGQWAGSVDLGAHSAGWQPLGAGDFNKDGTSDLAWYNPTSNDVEVWLVSNGHWTESVNLGAHPAGSTAVGLGDFDHNGVTDIMWRDTNTGHIENWMLAFS